MKLNQQQIEILSETCVGIVQYLQRHDLGKDDLPRFIRLLNLEQLERGISPGAAASFCRDVKSGCLALFAVVDGEELLPESAVLGVVKIKH